MASRGSWLRRGAAVIGAAALAVTLTGCGPFDFENVMGQWTTTELDCATWSVTPKYGPMILGPAKDPVTQEELELYAEAVDGAGVLLYRSTAQSTIAFDAQKSPLVADFIASPTLNPIISGYYFEGEPTRLGTNIGHCDGIPFTARAYLTPGLSSLSSTPPSFDVFTTEPVAGFAVDDLTLGGTAEPTGATVTLLADAEWPLDYEDPGILSDDEYRILRSGGQIYRITITGVTRDGTVTMSLPAGAMISTRGDGSSANAAIGEVTASVDATGPLLGTLDDVTRQLLPGEESAVVEWAEPSAADPSGVADQACSPASGSSFPVGETSVTCTSTDTLGNRSSSAFAVRVLAAQAPAVQIVPLSADAVVQGGSARFTVTGTDYAGVSAPLAADDYTVESSVDSDVIVAADGAFTATFPHASPHVLTVTQTSTGATAQVTVEVTPMAVPASPPAETPSAGAGLATTGGDSAMPIAAGVTLTAVGLALLVRRRIASR